MSSSDTSLTLTKSIPVTMPSAPTINQARPSVILTSVSLMGVTALSLQKPSGQTEIGELHSCRRNERSSLLICIAAMNSMSTKNTLSDNLLELRCLSTREYSTSIGQSIYTSPNPIICSSQASAVSVTLSPTTSSVCKGTIHTKVQTNMPRLQSILTHLSADAGTPESA